VESRFLEPPREKEISTVRKIGNSKNRRWHEITLYLLQGIVFLTTRKAKRKNMALSNGHNLGFYPTQKLEPPWTHDKQHQQESQA